MTHYRSAVSSHSINQAVWSHQRSVDRFTRARGWFDASERTLVERVRREHPDADVLDIGVGAGRTVPLIEPWAGSYVAVDFTPALTSAAQRRFPDVDIRDGDARKLTFGDNCFDVVVFSANGLDAVGHDDRARALAEIRRVLRAGGAFVFSTHNHDGPGPRDRPWRLPPLSIRQPRSSARDLVARGVSMRGSLARYRELRPLSESSSDWSLTTSGAHGFGVMVHYVSRAGLLAELVAAGFDGHTEIWDDRKGEPADPSSPRRPWYFNVLTGITQDSTL